MCQYLYRLIDLLLQLGSQMLYRHSLVKIKIADTRHGDTIMPSRKLYAISGAWKLFLWISFHCARYFSNISKNI